MFCFSIAITDQRFRLSCEILAGICYFLSHINLIKSNIAMFKLFYTTTIAQDPFYYSLVSLSKFTKTL